MKKLLTALFLISSLFISNPSFSQVSVTMGAGYQYDVYYSLQNGIIDLVDRADWDLGFCTDASGASILINGDKGLELYTYPKADTSAWMNIDTNGLAMWPVMFDGEDHWMNGAFNTNSHGFPDYGWGIKNISTNEIIGDSLYVLKLADGTFKQVWVVKKDVDGNRFDIRFADIDNTSELEETLELGSFTDMNFAYYNFDDGFLFEREPAITEWDLLFTRYQAFQPQGVFFPVTGVYTNLNNPGNRFPSVGHDFNDWFMQSIDTVKTVIGFNWKYFDFSTGWVLDDSLVFFISDQDGNIHKIYFTYFAGTTSGDIEFEQNMVSVVGVEEADGRDESISLSPNPAENQISVRWTHALGSDATIHIFNAAGKEVLKEKLTADFLEGGEVSLDISSLQTGMYIVSLVSANRVVNEKLMVR